MTDVTRRDMLKMVGVSGATFLLLDGNVVAAINERQKETTGMALTLTDGVKLNIKDFHFVVAGGRRISIPDVNQEFPLPRSVSLGVEGGGKAGGEQAQAARPREWTITREYNAHGYKATLKWTIEEPQASVKGSGEVGAADTVFHEEYFGPPDGTKLTEVQIADENGNVLAAGDVNININATVNIKKMNIRF